jgi:putative Flp pilus-assembly TadE/G-like protein
MLLRSPQSGARRRGISLVLIVVSLVAILSVLALSLEGGLLLSERRTAQATADSAAMAAAADFYWNWYTNFGTDPQKTAYNSAMYTAGKNGYTNDGTNTKVDIYIPPKTGPYAGKAAYAEVVVTYYHTRGFSSLFGTDKVPVRARAVAVGKPNAGEFGILVLDPTSKSAFNAGGGGTITVKDTPIIVDSASQEGSIANGGTSISAPSYYLAGNYTTAGGGAFTGTMNVNQRAAPDPLADLPVPDPSTMTVQQKKKVQLTSGTTVLYPGVYKGGISASSTANVVMMPGIYYMDSGGFQFTGQGSLTGDGVMIYNYPGNGQSNGVDISASGLVHLSPPTSGIYQGIVLFQDRTSNVAASISGGSNMDITGTFYFAGALLTVTGSGGFANFGSQYISYDLNVQGSGQIYIDWEPNKVAQVRLITIVE